MGGDGRAEPETADDNVFLCESENEIRMLRTPARKRKRQGRGVGSDGEDAEEVENDHNNVNHIMSSFKKHRELQQPGSNREEKESGVRESKEVAEDEGSNWNRIDGAGGGDSSERRAGLTLRKQQATGTAGRKRLTGPRIFLVKTS